jgi:hypothetical protein
MDVLLTAQNARDPWLPDAVAIAGAKHGQPFLTDVLAQRVPTDKTAAGGIARVVQLLTQSYAARPDLDVVVPLIGRVPGLDPLLGRGILQGVTAGWPANTTPTLTDAHRTALAAARRASPAELAESYANLAKRWALPDVFGEK